MPLSQEEIDKLVSDSSDGAAGDAGQEKQSPQAVLSKVTDGLKRSIQNIIPILVSAENVEITLEDAVQNSLSAAVESLGDDKSICSFPYEALCEGSWIIYVSNNLALDISQKMMGQEGAEELNEALMSAMVEAMNNMLGAYSTALAEEFEDEHVSQGEVKFVDGDGSDAVASGSGIAADSNVWLTKMQVVVDDLKGEMGLILSDECLGALVEKHPATVAPSPADETAVEAQGAAEVGTQKSADDRPITSGGQAEAQAAPVAVFEELQPRQAADKIRGLDLIMDVPLNITVELGRKSLSVKDILALTPGSLVELEKLAGEAVDIMVNGKLFAKGEVVVIDENFGIRVSSIVTPKERIERMRDT